MQRQTKRKMLKIAMANTEKKIKEEKENLTNKYNREYERLLQERDQANTRNQGLISQAESEVPEKMNPDSESKVTVKKRELLQSLSDPRYENGFAYTKAVLFREFFEPNSISKNEFQPESNILRQAADLRRVHFEHVEKLERLHNVSQRLYILGWTC